MIQSSRRVMSVISQDPVLFIGSLRINLDPLEEHEDNEISVDCTGRSQFEDHGEEITKTTE